MQTSKDYLHVFLDMGDALLNSGAENFPGGGHPEPDGLCLWCYPYERFRHHVQHCYYYGISRRWRTDADTAHS